VAVVVALLGPVVDLARRVLVGWERRRLNNHKRAEEANSDHPGSEGLGSVPLQPRACRTLSRLSVGEVGVS
jgi:hypothetical protein